MGGNALKKIHTSRINKEEFDQVCNTIKHHLDANNIMFDIMKSYSNKDSFGDVDVVIKNKLGTDQVSKLIQIFNPTEYIKNGNVVSLDIPVADKLVQVDFISHSPEEYDFACNYYAFNDAGNIIGRIFHKMGLKFGHNGLWLPLRDGNNKFHNILVTLDHKEAMEFIGFDYSRYLEGFASLEDIFEYVSSNPRFNSEIYLFDNLNAVARIRDKKRKTYNSFLKWCSERTFDNYAWNPDKTVYLDDIFLVFPHVKEEYEIAWKELETKKLAATMFNGNMVSELTGYTNKELGRFMAFLKKSDWTQPKNLVELDVVEIQQKILLEWKEFVLQ